MQNKLVKLLLNNIGYKIAAFIFALLLWSYVLAVEDPDTEKPIPNVPLVFVNEDVLNRENLCVRGDKSEILKDIDVPVTVNRNNYRNATASTLRAVVDLSSVKAAGEYDLPVQVTSQLNAVKVNMSTPPKVHVEIDHLLPSSAIPVQVDLAGEPPEGYYFGPPSTEPTVIQLSGPSKDVERVRQAVVTLDRTNLTRSYNDSVPVELRDEQGSPISSASFSNVLSVIVKMDVLPQKTVPINRDSLLVGVDKIEPGYEINLNNIKLTPETVEIAGPDYVLAKIGSVDVESVDVQGLSASMKVKTPIKLPDGVIMTRPSPAEAELYIDINEITETVQFNDLPITIEGAAKNQVVTIDPEKVSISITAGVSAKINTISRGAIAPYIDVTGYSPGQYTLDIQCHIAETLPPKAIRNIIPSAITVRIEEK